MIVIEIILWLMVTWLAAGFLFAIAFVIKGVQVVDEGAHGSSVGFRIIIIPGTMIFWPVLLKKWIRAIKTTQNDQTA